MAKYDDWIEKTLDRMDARALAGQVFAPRADSWYAPRDATAYQRLVRLVKHHKVGGFVLFQGEVPGQALLTRELQEIADVPLLFGQDAEWGVGMRLRDATSFPSMSAIAASRDDKHAYSLGRVTAAEARVLGVHHVYAPVVDVNNNASNPIINVRSFGEDVNLVARFGAAVVRGLQDGGVLATAKHFPGHGDTNVDSHLDMPALRHDVDRLSSVEWVPFAAAIDAGVASIMVGHLAMTSIDGPDAPPASLSRNIVTGLLRERFGFGGLVVSDALDMLAIRNRYEPGHVAVTAVLAGVDILLTSPDDDAAIEAVVKAIDTGRIPEPLIKGAVRRVLEAKARVGLPDAGLPDPTAARDVVGCRAHLDAAREAARAGATLAVTGEILPISDNARVLVVTLNDDDAGIGRSAPFVEAFRAVAETERTKHIEVGRTVYAEQTGAIVEAAQRDVDVVVVVAVVAVRSFSGEIGLPPDHAMIVRELSARRPLVFVGLGSPYVLGEVSANTEAALLGYGHAACMQRACADVLRGRAPVSGRLPITVSADFPFGFGVVE